MKDRLEHLRRNAAITALRLTPTPWHFKKPKRAEKVPILIPGGVGDVVLALPAVIAIRKRCGPVVIYCNWPKVYSYFEKDEVHKNDEFPGYDYWIRLIGIVRFEFAQNFVGFDNKNVESLFLSWRSELAGWERIVDCHPFMDYDLVTKAVAQGNNRENLAFKFLGIPFTGHKVYDVTDRRNHANLIEPYITIHHGYESTLKGIGTRCTKNWHPKMFAEFVRIFQQQRKIRVVQLGGATGESIDWVDFDFRGKLSLPQSFRILAGSLAHVDGDSGLVHAARAMGVRSVVLWGSTHSSYYGHRENINLNPSFCGGCFWLKPDWMSNCPLGYARPLCMDSTAPERVAEETFKVAMASLADQVKQGQRLRLALEGKEP